MGLEDIFDSDPYEDQALMTQLGGAPLSPVPALDEEKKRQKMLAELAKKIKTPLKPQSSRQVMESVDPMTGPTRAREPQASGMARADQRLKSFLTDHPGAPKATTFGASAPFPAAASGVVSSLLDRTQDRRDQGKGGVLQGLLDAPGAIKEALTEANARAMVAPYQEQVPTVSNELAQRGVDPGAVGRFAIDAVTDPSNLIGGGEADDVGRAATKGVGMAAAAWLPGKLKKRLDTAGEVAKKLQLQDFLAQGGKVADFEPQMSDIQTSIRNVVRNDLAKGDSRLAQKITDAYETLPLPTDKFGVNWDARRPLEEVFTHDAPGTATTTSDPTAKGVQFADWAKQRLGIAYQQGVSRAEKESWGDSRWLYHLTNGDPTMAAQVTRMLGAFSPGQKTDANTLNAIEGFLRSARGESAEQILGRKIPDPSRPGKQMRTGATLSYAHPRPSTVEDNLQRAMQLGRLFAEKVEALSGAEVGLHDAIPIDMWLMRAMGAQSDVTPGPGAYRLVSEAMAKQAAQHNENPFEYMAKVWMGMQDIAGTPSPSFQASTSKLRLPGHLGDPANRQSILDNINTHAAGIRNKSLSDVGEVSPIATNPKLAFPEFLAQTQQIMRQGMGRDVLGKQKVIQNRAPITLDSLLASTRANEMTANMQRGAAEPGHVTMNMPLEAVPGQASGVMPGFRAQPQAAQDKQSERLFKGLLNPEGKVGIAEAILPGQTAPPLKGRGDWTTPQGVQENNLLSTLMLKLRTAKGGTQINPAEERKASFVNDALASFFGQDALAGTALQFKPFKSAGRDALRVWPGGGQPFPETGSQALRGLLPPGDFAIQHRDNGVDVIKLAGGPMTHTEIQAIEQAATGVLTSKAQRGAGARPGLNISQSAAYRMPPWGAEGSRQVTTNLVGPGSNWSKFSSAERKAVDQEAMTAAANTLRQVARDKATSPAHKNYLRIISETGFSGLVKALKDPSQALPVLATLGLSGTLLGSRSAASPDER